MCFICLFPRSIGWLVGCFGLKGPLRQYFSLYRAVSQREGERREMIDERKNVRTTSCPTLIQISRTPRHWKFTQHYRTIRASPPRSMYYLNVLKLNGYTFRGSNSYFRFLPPVSFGVNSQRKEFAPVGTNVFPLRINSILKGCMVQKSQEELTKVVSFF